MGHRALIAGATGLVGGELLTQLLAAPDVEHLTVLTRRPLPGRGNDERLTVHLVDFNRLDDDAVLIAGDWVFCTLGTTIRSAGTQEAFRRVDFEYPLALARLAATHGVGHFLLVSAVGADPESRIFYNRVKGEVEGAIAALGFRSVTIARPSFLLGHRHELRPGEFVGKTIGQVLPRRYRSVPAGQVAAALIGAARQGRPGVHLLENAELLAVRR